MIDLKSKNEIKKIAESGRMVAAVLKKLKSMVIPGLITQELDDTARKMTKEFGARPAFLGYRGYTAAVCVSINDEVVHGFPSKKRICKEGDIISLDFGVEYGGYYADAALTVGVGKISQLAKKLMDVTEQSLYKGIEKAVAGNKLYDISAAVQQQAESNGFSVVRDFVGHGVGRKLHEEPFVPNFGKAGTGILLEVGTVIAIEPMVNEKKYDVKVLSDEWTVVTCDKGLSAHYEHTIAITESGPVILTKE
ncbi:MAG: type I methionyl aminopeptidase [bacterium]